MNKYNDLRNALSELLLGVPYDPETTHPENFKIAHLVTVARAYGMGDADLDTLVNAFRGTGFDVRLWVAENFDE